MVPTLIIVHSPMSDFPISSPGATAEGCRVTISLAGAEGRLAAEHPLSVVETAIAAKKYLMVFIIILLCRVKVVVSYVFVVYLSVMSGAMSAPSSWRSALAMYLLD